MQSYEIAVLFDSDLEIDFEKANATFEKIITANNGKIAGTDNWGKKRLAYDINGHDSALYVFYTVELVPASLAALNDDLNITDEVVRFLITKPDLKKQAKADAERAVKLKKAAARSSKEDENDEA